MAGIQVSALTEDELQALEARGVDTSKGSVPVPVAATAPRAQVGDTVLPTSKPIEAPAPPPDVVARARERLAAAKTLAGEGSSYEAKTKDGAILEKVGEVKTPEPPKKEDIVADADKTAFLIAMLGGSQFKKTYEMFGGRIAVTFQTRSAALDARCAQQAYKDDEFEPLGNIEVQVRQQLRMNRYYEYQFVGSLVSIAAENTPPRMFDSEATTPGAAHGVGASALRAARIDLEKELSQPMRVAMRSLHSKFENLVAQMTLEADNPDFWVADSET
jgi:hypothetical protein